MPEPVQPPVRISVTMALDSLREQVTSAAEAKAHYEQQQAIRDDLIRDCRAAKVPFGTLMRITGLSKDRLIKIAHSGPKAYQ